MIVEAILGSAALQAVIVGASGVLAGAALGGRMARRAGPSGRTAESAPSDRPAAADGPEMPAGSAGRVPDDPGRPVTDGQPSPGCAPESGRTVRAAGRPSLGASDSRSASRPDAPASGDVVPKTDAAVPAVRPQPGPASVHMSDATQVRELVGWMAHWEYFGTFSHVETLKFYHAWAREGRVVTLPDHAILRLLAEHPAVRRRRDRVKDPVTGRVRKNASGTPERETTYTFARVAVAAPGGVAASDVVAGHRVKRAA